MDDGKFNRSKNSSSFFAFHYGKRNCPGQALALKELIIVLAMIFMSYNIKHPDSKNNFEIKSVFSGVINQPNILDICLERR